MLIFTYEIITVQGKLKTSPCFLDCVAFQYDIGGKIICQLANGNSFVMPFASEKDFNNYKTSLLMQGVLNLQHPGYFVYCDDSEAGLHNNDVIDFESAPSFLKKVYMHIQFPKTMQEIFDEDKFPYDEFYSLVEALDKDDNSNLKVFKKKGNVSHVDFFDGE